MDTKAYIESGIIESYVLGLASAEEATELGILCKQYADIKNAVAEFEALIEKQAFKDAVAPPAKVKDKLMFALASEFARAQTPVVSLPVETKVKSFSPIRYFAAASVILLIASTVLNVYLYNNYLSVNNKYQALLTERSSLQANNNVFRTRINNLEQSMRVIENPDVKTITLKGVAGKENNLAAVYWDTKTKEVYLLPTKMDSTPSDKQYQLWAIVDGKPVDAGVFADCDGLCKMKKIPNAQAFAITLEKKGGSPAPTFSAMYVLGKV
ncbi:MAG TPA: anti-sigma factor [Chitinophagaceae bacterium]|nr:anti-sigma factor [Chitinophagaceae bacterium]